MGSARQGGKVLGEDKGARFGGPFSVGAVTCLRGRDTVQESGWLFLLLVVWALGLLIALLLVRMSGDRDRAARHERKGIDQDADVTNTRRNS